MSSTTPARRRAPSLLILLALLLVSAGGGCQRSAPAANPPRAVRVTTLEPRAAAEAGRRYAGVLEPRTRSDVGFRVPGRVLRIGQVEDGGRARELHEGDRVRKGQLLAALDAADLDRQAQAAAAAVATAGAQLEAAQVAAAQAERDAVRARELAAAGAITPVQLDRAETALGQAKANLEAASSRRAASAQQYAVARSAADDARLLSPIDGVIARRTVDIGETVAPGVVAFSLVDTSELELVFQIPDTRIAGVRLGDALPIRVDAQPDVTLVGRVAAIHPVADPALRTFTVELGVANADGRLRAGTVASVGLDPAAATATLTVPLASVVRLPDGDGLGVFVVPPAGDAATLVPIVTADIVGNDVVVASGLTPGARVVTQGAQLLRDGEKVQVVP